MEHAAPDRVHDDSTRLTLPVPGVVDHVIVSPSIGGVKLVTVAVHVVVVPTVKEAGLQMTVVEVVVKGSPSAWTAGIAIPVTRTTATGTRRSRAKTRMIVDFEFMFDL
jgi:hypothetical protein